MSWDRWVEELHYSLHGGSLSVQLGHFIYDCKGARPYVSRPSRTQQLENPKLLAKLKAEGKPSVEVPEEFKSKCVYLCPAMHIRSVACNLNSSIDILPAGAALRIASSRQKRRSARRVRTRARVRPRNGNGAFMLTQLRGVEVF